MTAHERHAAVVRACYRAINASDFAAIGDMVTYDCVRHFLRGDSPIAGDHHGRDAVVATYRYVHEHCAGDHRVEVGNVLANSVIAASHHREIATRAADGAHLDQQLLVRWRLVDGLIAEIWDFANDVPTVNSFLS